MKKIYSFFAASLLASNLGATIHYTDLTPDSSATVSSGSYLDIDVDGDNSSDFTFALNGFGTSMYSISISTFNDIITDNLASNPSSCYVTSFFSGATINSSNQWADYTRNIRLDDQGKRNFEGKGELFIGFRLENGGDYNYGWMLVELTASLEFKVKSFAYEDTPNTPIVIGDTGSNVIGLNENQIREINVYPTIATESLHINSNTTISEIKIFSATGSLVHSSTPNLTKIELNVANLSIGQYIITLINDKGQASTQKFVRKD